jgi:hypothetical protein
MNVVSFWVQKSLLKGTIEMADNNHAAPFVARQGYQGWMVYDRQRKGPALLGTDLAVNLTKEQAHHIQQVLTAEWKRKQSSSQRR